MFAIALSSRDLLSRGHRSWLIDKTRLCPHASEPSEDFHGHTNILAAYIQYIPEQVQITF